SLALTTQGSSSRGYVDGDHKNVLIMRGPKQNVERLHNSLRCFCIPANQSFSPLPHSRWHTLLPMQQLEFIRVRFRLLIECPKHLVEMLKGMTRN
ncbi:hypothetical protein L9F63_007959, partial [Diploptera punctata]